MGMEETPVSKAPEDRVFVTSHAFQMAKGWLQKMSGGADFDPETDKDDASLPEPESRPLRLGLGAKFIPHAQAAAVASSPVVKRLKKQIDSAKRASSNAAEEQSQGAQDSDEDEDENESRTNAFKAKTDKPVTSGSTQQHSESGKKKGKKKKKKQKTEQ